MTRTTWMGGVSVALLAALAAAFLLVDWRFWYRLATLPDDPGEWPASYYQPAVAVPGDEQPFFPAAAEGERSISEEALEAAAAWADEHNSAALLVLHRGVLQFERYWRDIGPDSLFTGRAMTRTLIPPLIASAMAEGYIDNLDEPIGNYLEEWRGDPRGEITIRELLTNLSGLEVVTMAGDASPGNKNNRLALSSDFRAAALNYDLAEPPGTVFAFTNSNAQLLGALLESATGIQYEDYLDSHIWAPLGAGPSEMYFDRPGGMPTVYCCFRATPRDWLRFGHALSLDGAVNGRRLWPEGTVAQMTTPTALYPNYAYQVWVGNPDGEVRPYSMGSDQGAPHGPPIAADNFFFLEGGGYRTMLVFPELELVILRLGYYHPDWKTSTIPNLILAGMRQPAAAPPVSAAEAATEEATAPGEAADSAPQS